MAHATSQEYADYTQTTAPTGIGLMLTRASRDVDRALLTAVYDVEDGVATDADVLTALKEATIEQVASWVPAGEDGTGAAVVYTDVAIGSVKLSGRTSAGSSGGSGARPLAPQARQVLELAGLTGHSPRTPLFRDC